ncbi:hypothetical protein LINGRAHAP2_LOCUS20000, partial [Linum grandiflorum]
MKGWAVMDVCQVSHDDGGGTEEEEEEWNSAEATASGFLLFPKNNKFRI